MATSLLADLLLVFTILFRTMGLTATSNIRLPKLSPSIFNPNNSTKWLDTNDLHTVPQSPHILLYDYNLSTAKKANQKIEIPNTGRKYSVRSVNPRNRKATIRKIESPKSKIKNNSQQTTSIQSKRKRNTLRCQE